VVTPNFDDHLSRALTLFGKAHILCDHPLVVDRIDPQKPEVQIVHVHGNYWFYDCCNLRDEIETRALFSPETSQTMASMLDNALSNHSPLVIGYSGWEGDVMMQALRRRLFPNRRLPYRLYWFCHRATEVESLPDWLRFHPDVCFVLPKAEPEETEPLPRPERVEAPEMTLSADASVSRLPATEVLDALVQALSLAAPELTRDPLGFFARQLSGTLPLDTLEEGGGDPYFFSGLSAQVEQANVLLQREGISSKGA
jgi:hypothetical protein